MDELKRVFAREATLPKELSNLPIEENHSNTQKVYVIQEIYPSILAAQYGPVVYASMSKEDADNFSCAANKHGKACMCWEFPLGGETE